MGSLWKISVGALGMAVFLGGCSARPDVDISGPTLTLDTTSAVFPTLKRAVVAHPKATTFRVSWNITPDPNRPLESLPHFLVYNRKTKTLTIHRDTNHYEKFVGVTDDALRHVIGKEESAIELMRAGCKQQWLPESRNDKI